MKHQNIKPNRRKRRGICNKSKNKTQEKLAFEFPKKTEIISIIAEIEEKRNTLCYGKPQKTELIQAVINNFNKLKEKFREAGLHEL